MLGLKQVLALARRQARRQPSPGHLQSAASALCLASQQQWIREVNLRLALHVVRMAIAWTSATNTSRAVAAHPSAVLGDPSLAGSMSYLRIGGDVAELAEVWQRLPRRQLVVLGEPGSGKTTAVLRCILDLLPPTTMDGPVPVFLSLDSWNPTTQHPHAWITERIYAEYPFLRDTAEYGSDVVTYLLAHGHLLPVLDGLDEMPPTSRGKALDGLNRTLNASSPLILTCRSREYIQTVSATGRTLATAAVVELLPAKPHTVTDFLAAGTPARDRHWRDFTARLVAEPGPVADAMASPLMATMARAVYTERDSQPIELFNTDRFPDRAAVERHLLSAFIPAVYTVQGDPYDPVKAQRWLSFLARHLTRRGTSDLRWWQLYRAPGLIELWLLLTVSFTFFATALWVAAIAAFIAIAPPGASNLRLETSGQLGDLVATLITIALVTPFVVAITDGIRRPPRLAPDSGIRSLGRRLAAGAAWSVVVGLQVAVVCAAGVFLFFRNPAELGYSAMTKIFVLIAAIVLTIALPVGLLIGLIRWLRLPGRSAESINVAASIRGGRRADMAGIFVIFLLCGPVPFTLAAATTGLGTAMLTMDSSFNMAEFAGPIQFGLAIGLITAAWVTPMTFAVSRWLRFRLAIVYLALRGLLPWRLLRFLDDAHRRGVLRQVGSVYQFRHAHLHSHLASRK